MTQEITNNVIKFVIVFVIIAATAWFLFLGPGKQLLAGILTSIPKEIREESEYRLDITARNIERCVISSDNNCTCDIFPSWPATFVKDSKLIITSNETNKNSIINLAYMDKNLKNTTVGSAISARDIDNSQNVIFKTKKEINWKSEPPLFIQEGVGRKGFVVTGKIEYKVASSSAYKENNTIYLLISSSDNAQEIENKIKTMRKCVT